MKKLIGLTVFNVLLLGNAYLVASALASFVAGIAWASGLLFLASPLFALAGVVAALVRPRSIPLAVVNAIILLPYVWLLSQLEFAPA